MVFIRLYVYPKLQWFLYLLMYSSPRLLLPWHGFGSPPTPSLRTTASDSFWAIKSLSSLEL